MKNAILVFPGQGSQYVGMGKDLLNLEPARNIYEKANKTLSFDLTKLMFEGPSDKLQKTEYTQPAILTHSVAMYEVLKSILNQRNINLEEKIECVLGHSVGEYSALVCSGAINFEDAVSLVHARGKYMQNAVPLGKGKMFAAINIPQDLLLKGCSESSNESDSVMPANFNEPNQVVVSGSSVACQKLSEWLKNNIQSRYRFLELKVSAPFHSSMMLPAQEELAEDIKKTQINSLKFTYIANVDAKKYNHLTSQETIRSNLIQQVSSSVLWTQSIQTIEENKVILEIGPGKTLSGLIKKINSNHKIINLDKNILNDEFINDSLVHI